MGRVFRRGSAVLAVSVLLAAVVLAAVIGACGSSARAHTREAAPSSAQNGLSLSVSATPTGRPIPAGFLGLSLEYTAIEPYAGTDPKAINPVLIQLIRNLSPGQSPNLRIGGDSTDWVWWPVAGATRPGGIRLTLNDRWLGVMAALTHDLGAKLILGVDLEMDSSTDAAAEANALVNAIGRSSIQALELGNEPELYGSFTWYVSHSGVHVHGRPASWDFSDYLSDFSQIGKALPTGIALAGPATGGPRWIPELGSFLPAEPRVKVATLHRYPLQQCYIAPSASQYPSVAHILSPSASRGLADSIARYVGVAHARHDALRIDEMNTVSCGVAPGVANGFVSALWALDASFQMARVGVDGVNFHTYPKAPYELFTFKHAGGRWEGDVAPEYYGLLAFAQAAPPGSRLLRLSGSLGDVRAWATRAPDATDHVVLINDDTTRSQTVRVRIAGAGGPATLELLRGKGLTSSTGVSLGGQSFGTATRTGTLQGRSTATTLALKRDAYVVRVPPASAALITLPPPPAG